MTQRLILAIDEHWPHRPDCPWVLLGPDGRPLSEGHSEPRHWPAADSCEVLLCGAQCLWLEVLLPRAARRDQPRLLAYALEDRLLKDPDTQHLSITHRRADDGDKDRVGVLVVARDRLRALLAQLAAIGRQPQRVLAEVQTAPADENGWHLCLTGSGAILRSSPDTGLALDADILAPLLSAQAATARAANRAPEKLGLHLAPGHPAPDLTLLQTESGLALHTGAAYVWWAGAADGRAANLLHGDFSAKDNNPVWMGRLRPALLLAGAALALWLVANVGEVLWAKHRLGQIQDRIARVYQSSFPNSPAVAPAAQMRQQLNLERARQGLLRDDDALALLAQAAEALGTDATASIAALRYEDGRLDLSLTGAAQARGEALVGLLARRGLLADLRRDGNTVHLILRRENLQ